MGFNFGAFLGGAASQIVEDIDEQENEIKLRTRKILDRQVEQTLANQKEYRTKKEKVKNQMNALVPLFGDDPDALAKARSIVAGGDNHYNFMFNKLTTAQDNGQNINEIYSLIPNKDAVGFKNVEDATNSLVTMAELPEIKLGETSGMAKLFGLDQKAYYNKERKILEEAGQIQSATAGVPEKGVFAQGKLDLGKMKKVFKSADEFEASLLNNINKYKVGSAEYNEASKKYEDFRVKKAKTSASYITEELRQKNQKSKTAISYGNFRAGWEEGVDGIKDKFGDSITVGKNILIKGNDDYNAYVQKEVDAYNKEFVQNILNDVEGGDLATNGLKLINATPSLKKIANQIQKDELKGDKKDTTTMSPKEQAKNLIQDNKDLSLNVVVGLKNISPNLTKVQLHEFLLKSYPKPEGISEEDYNDNLKNLIEETFKGFEDKQKSAKEKSQSIKDLYGEKKEDDKIEKVPPRPDDGSFFDSDAEDAWDDKYGDTHFKDGTPKPKKTSVVKADKEKFVKELGPEKGYAAYKQAVINQLRPIYAGKAESVFNSMEKAGKV